MRVNLNTIVKAIKAKLPVRSIDSIIGGIDKSVKRLYAVADRHEAAGNEHRRLSHEHRQMAASHFAEVERAERIADRFAGLIK